MKSRIFIAGLAALVAAGTVMAQDQATPAQTAAGSAAAAPAPQSSAAPAEGRGSEVVCRSNRATGSRIRSNRVCKTRDQWAADQAALRDSMNDMSRSAGTTGASACNPGTPGC